MPMYDQRIQEPRVEEIRSYAKIWTMPLKIYAIEKTRLIIPVSLWDAVFFIIWELIFITLNFLVPPFHSVPNTIKFLLVPYLLMKFMSLVKLEGKQPHKYFFDLLVFMALPKRYEYFESSELKLKKFDFNNEKVRFTTYVRHEMKKR